MQPDDLVLVPRRLTEAMLEAYRDYANMRRASNNIPTVPGGWSVMIDAAPALPPVPEIEGAVECKHEKESVPGVCLYCGHISIPAPEIEALVKRLRAANNDCTGYEPSLSLLQRTAHEAADALQSQAAETARLRGALEQIATGGISDEPRNYRDTVSIMRRIALEGLGRAP